MIERAAGGATVLVAVVMISLQLTQSLSVCLIHFKVCFVYALDF